MKFVALLLLLPGLCLGGPFLTAPNSRIFLKWSEVAYQMKTKATTDQIEIIESSLRKWTGVPVRRVSKGYNLQISLKRCSSQGMTHFRGSRPPLIVVDPEAPDGFATVMDHEVHHLIRPFFHP